MRIVNMVLRRVVAAAAVPNETAGSFNSLLFILLSVPLMISTNTFSYLAKNPSTGDYDHSVPTVTLLAEVTKAMLSLLQLASIVGVTNVWSALREMPGNRVVLFVVPAACHCITNVCSPPASCPTGNQFLTCACF